MVYHGTTGTNSTDLYRYNGAITNPIANSRSEQKILKKINLSEAKIQIVF